MRFVLVALTFLVAFAAPAASTAAAGPVDGRWFSAWSRSQGIMISQSADPIDGGRAPAPLLDQSVRNIVRVSGAGTAVRIRLSNRYGSSVEPDETTPVTVAAATVALRSSGADLVESTLRPLTFDGHATVDIPAGGTVVSDSVTLTVRWGDDLAVSLQATTTDTAPGHGASFVTSYVTDVGAGDHTTDIGGAAYTQKTFTTLIISGVDVQSGALLGTIAATGSSVADGHGSDIDGHNDWASWLGLRVNQELPDKQHKTVVNNGLGGSMAASSCSTPVSGPSVEERVQHDSLEQVGGLTHLIVYAGTNDIGGGCTADEIIAAYRSTIAQAAAAGVKVLITTITPRASYTEVQHIEREKVNAWVRDGGDCSGECHLGLDFDAVVRDPANPNQINPSLDSGDGIHPTGEGYKLIAASIPLEALYEDAVPAPATAASPPANGAPSMESPSAPPTRTLPATGGGLVPVAIASWSLVGLLSATGRRRPGVAPRSRRRSHP